MSCILVTGGTGFLGSRVVSKLLSEGHNVRFSGRNKAAAAPLEDRGAVFVQQDLSCAEDFDLTGVDAVIHCAALSSPWGRFEDFYATNVSGTEKLCRAASNAGVGRFIHVSTPSIYFDFRDRLDIRETDPLPRRLANDYARTKLLAEQAVVAYSAKGLNTIILRPRGIFGRGDTSILPRLMHANATTGIPFFRNGRFLMDLTHVDNVVHAIQCALSSSACAGAVFNVSNGEPACFSDLLQMIAQFSGTKLNLRAVNYTMADLLAGAMELVSRGTGREPTFTRYTLGLLAFSQTLNIDAARNDLGYSPVVSLQDGLAEALAPT